MQLVYSSHKVGALQIFHEKFTKRPLLFTYLKKNIQNFDGNVRNAKPDWIDQNGPKLEMKFYTIIVRFGVAQIQIIRLFWLNQNWQLCIKAQIFQWYLLAKILLSSGSLFNVRILNVPLITKSQNSFAVYISKMFTIISIPTMDWLPVLEKIVPINIIHTGGINFD